MGEIGCEDRELIHSAIQCLPDKHQKAIIGRFWKHLTIEEISWDLKVSWEEANTLINESVSLIKEFILKKDKNFKKEKSNYGK